MKVCPLCEGYTESRRRRCGTCDVPLVHVDEVLWSDRGGEETGANPWLGLIVGGKYRVTGVLGKGGMGTVYRAVHVTTLAPLALKILHPRLGRQEAYKRSLLLEARRASRVRGDHVARVLDAGETEDGSVFVAMELVEGVDLATLVREQGPLPPPLLLEVLVQVAQGLEDAHRAGLVHRDLSARNVMVEGRPGRFRAKILDFGIAREEREEDGPPGTWINPPYTAPEILQGGKADARADLYSLGVLAVELALGSLPPSGTRLEERVERALRQPPLELLKGVRLPRGLLALLRRLLDKDPARRPASAAEVRRRLEALRRPFPRWFQGLATTVLALGFLALPFRRGGGTEPYLAAPPASRSGLRLLAAPPDPVLPAQRIRIEDLARLELEAGGFPPGLLTVESYTAGRRSPDWRLPLPVRIRAGRILLDRSEDASWAAVLDRAAKTSGPQTLVFRLPGGDGPGRALAFTRVVLDRSPPRPLDLALQPSGVLRRSSVLTGRIVEDDEAALIEVDLSARRGGRLASLSLPAPKSGAFRFDVGRLLAARYRLERRDRVVLELRVEDRAGRTGRAALELPGVDFLVPRPVEAADPKGGHLLHVSEGWCALVLRLDRPPGPGERLKVEVDHRPAAGPAETLACEVRKAAGDRLYLALQPPAAAGEEPLPLRFRVSDAFGNEALPLEAAFRFLDLEFAPSFELGPGEGRLISDPENPGLARVYLATAAQELVYRCNEAFLPEPFLAERGTAGLEVLALGPGLCRLKLDPARLPAELDLRIGHRLLAGKGESGVLAGPLMRRRSTVSVVVLPEPPAFFVPPVAVDGGHWSSQLAEAEILVRAGGYFRLGPAFRWRLSEGGEPVGRFWRHAGGGWEPIGRRRRLTVAGMQKIRIDCVPGRNRFALECSDPLGRGLQGFLAGGRGLAALQHGEHRLVPILDFRHDATPPVPLDAFVEEGREVKLRFEEDARLGAGDPVFLVAGRGGQEIRGVVVPRPEGTMLEFRLPFDRVAADCGWAGLERGTFHREAPVERSFRVRTPAGTWRVLVTFRPTRSLLRTVRLSDLAPVRPGPGDELCFVPFLPPEGGEWRLGPPPGEPVPGGVSWKRPVIVTGIEPYMLADREVERGLWLAFMRDVSEHPPPRNVLPALVHAEDPLGVRRFTREGLRPDLSPFGRLDLAALCRADPHRPISGVTWFQAEAFCRWLGWRRFGRPDLFRMPLGVELEAAAWGGRPAKGRNALSAVERRRDPATAFRRYRALSSSGGAYAPARWPLAASEAGRLGDRTEGFDGSPVFGLELGLMEWVGDPPLAEGLGSDLYVRSLLANPRNLIAFLAEQRTGGRRPPPGFTRLRRLGVLRGLTWGAAASGGRDPADELFASAPGVWAGVLGVKRIVHATKDGAGPLGRIVRFAGFRPAGSSAFMRLVRERGR